MIEQQKQIGKKWLEKLLELMGFPGNVKAEYRRNELEKINEIWLVINEEQLTSQDMLKLIGKRGKSIDAIEYIINTFIKYDVNLSNSYQFKIELNNYRSRCHEELKISLQEIIQQVRKTGQEVEMTSLSLTESHEVHLFLKNLNDLTAENRGKEPNRRLIVKRLIV